MSEHAVIVDFKYAHDELGPLFRIEVQLEAAISQAGVGEFDGNDIAADLSRGNLYMYGPDADRLFEVIRPLLETSFPLGAIVTLQYGPPDDHTVSKTVTLG